MGSIFSSFLASNPKKLASNAKTENFYYHHGTVGQIFSKFEKISEFFFYVFFLLNRLFIEIAHFENVTVTYTLKYSLAVKTILPDILESINNLNYIELLSFAIRKFVIHKNEKPKNTRQVILFFFIVLK